MHKWFLKEPNFNKFANNCELELIYNNNLVKDGGVLFPVSCIIHLGVLIEMIGSLKDH